jgi:hypothetical protein
MSLVKVLCIDIMQFRNTVDDPIIIEEDLEEEAQYQQQQHQQQLHEIYEDAQPDAGESWVSETDLDDWLNIL